MEDTHVVLVPCLQHIFAVHRFKSVSAERTNMEYFDVSVDLFVFLGVVVAVVEQVIVQQKNESEPEHVTD